MKITHVLIATAVACASQLALAEGEGSQSLQLRYTSFGGAESLYRSYSYQATNADGSAFNLRAVQSLRETTGFLPAVNTGGNDLEFSFSNKFSNFDGTYSLGFAFPNTFADSSTSFVYGITRSLSDSLVLSVKGYSGLTSANALFLSKNFKLSDSMALDAEVGGIITGYSTIDETTGAPKRNVLINARLNYQVSEMLNAFVGVTNTLGDSTRFSLNSSVGNKLALTFGLGGKF
jgi:hypothetical protein